MEPELKFFIVFTYVRKFKYLTPRCFFNAMEYSSKVRSKTNLSQADVLKARKVKGRILQNYADNGQGNICSSVSPFISFPSFSMRVRELENNNMVIQ